MQITSLCFISVYAAMYVLYTGIARPQSVYPYLVTAVRSFCKQITLCKEKCLTKQYRFPAYIIHNLIASVYTHYCNTVYSIHCTTTMNTSTELFYCINEFKKLIIFLDFTNTKAKHMYDKISMNFSMSLSL